MSLYVINQNVGEPGYTQSVTATGNVNLQWEVSTNWDAALEFSLFKNRLNGAIEYFHRNTSNLLLEVSLAPSTGLSSHNENASGLYNKGLELMLNCDIIRNNNIKWNMGLNATFLKNRITCLPIPAYTRNANYNKVEEGHSVYEWWLYQWHGVDPATGLNLYEIADDHIQDTNASTDIVTIGGQSYTTTLNKAKEAYSGSSIPKIFGGINTAFKWRNFCLDLQLYYQLGGYIYDRAYANAMAGYIKTELVNLHKDLTKMWKQPGDVTNIAMVTNNAYASNIEAARSTRWITSSNMLEINSLSVSYLLPEKLCERLKLKTCKLYIAADHLFIWNARQGLNSNYSLSQYDSGGDRYSPARTVSLGLNFSF